MITGKAIVYAEVIKQTSPFKAAVIHTATGLSRQVVYHHLTKLVEEGFLEKDGMFYMNVARNDLIDALTSISSNNVSGLITEANPLLNTNYEVINKSIERVVVVRSAKVPGYREIGEKYNAEIDKAINTLKSLRRYANSKQYSEKKALETIRENEEDYWKILGQQFLAAGTTYNDFTNHIVEEVEE